MPLSPQPVNTVTTSVSAAGTSKTTTATPKQPTLAREMTPPTTTTRERKMPKYVTNSGSIVVEPTSFCLKKNGTLQNALPRCVTTTTPTTTTLHNKSRAVLPHHRFAHGISSTGWPALYEELRRGRLAKKPLLIYVGEAASRDPRTVPADLLKVDVLVCRRLLEDFRDRTALPVDYVNSLRELREDNVSCAASRGIRGDKALSADIATILKHYPKPTTPKIAPLAERRPDFISTAERLASTLQFEELEELVLTIPARQRVNFYTALDASTVGPALLNYSANLPPCPASVPRRTFFNLIATLYDKFPRFATPRSIFLDALNHQREEVLLDVIATFDPLHIGTTTTITPDTFYPALRRLFSSNAEVVRNSQRPLMFLLEVINGTTPDNNIALAVLTDEDELVPLAVATLGTGDNTPRDTAIILVLLALLQNGSTSVAHHLLKLENLLPTLASILQAGGTTKEHHLKQVAKCYSLLFQAALQHRYFRH